MNDQMISLDRMFSPDHLKSFACEVFQAAGLTADHAREVADNLVMADLRGVDSHGVTRIPIYVERIRKGVVTARPDIRIEQTADAVAIVDGANGPGVVVGNVAMRKAIEIAKQRGIGVAAARNSNHFGICSYYAMQAVDSGCIGICLSNAPRSMAVWGGREPALGTNPMAIAVPAGSRPPIVLDMATSVVARGKIVEKAKRGERIPLGWALDRNGSPTEDARDGEAGVVLPFGGPKGSGLAILIDVLSGVLSGANYGRHIRNLYVDFENPQGMGHFFIAMDIGAFMPALLLGDRMADFIDDLKSSQKAPGFSEILMPGEIETRIERERMTKGIPLPDNVVTELKATGESYGVAFPG